jgi:hypothetical protein
LSPVALPVKAVPIRLTAELQARVDAVRPDMIPREPFVRHLIEVGLERLEEEG